MQGRLTQTLKLFTEVTGESFGVIFTWQGELSIIGSESFKNFIAEHSTEIWKSIGCQTKAQGRGANVSKPEHEEHLLELVKSDGYLCCTVCKLRKIVSLITRKLEGSWYV